MWLPYRIAFELAVALVICVLILSRFQHRGLRVAVSTAKELAIVMALYGTWQYIRRRAITRTGGAMENARWLWDLEQRMHLPSEAALQRVFIDNKPTMVFLNIYYGGLHVPAAAALLLWLFFRHRDRYASVRWIFAITIAGCLTMQALVPMAPPRFLNDLGFVDAGLKYNLSVYGEGGHGVSNELAAMPSLHVAWAVLVGLAVVLIGTSRWRWLALSHPALTILSITITANHWWLDGVVAVVILGLAVVVQRSAAAVVLWARSRYWRRTAPALAGAGSYEDCDDDVGDDDVGDGDDVAECPLSNIS
jgi:PAP2 superfamily